MAVEREKWTRRPEGSQVIMKQTWSNLLFLHWRFPKDLIQKSLPPGLFVDTFEGDAWMGVIPFEMHKVRPVCAPSIPWLSHFLELNLRTYVVSKDGRPGVWFYSLDASNPVAVAVAQTFFQLPYHFARMHTRVTSRPDSPTAQDVTYFSSRWKDQLGISRPFSHSSFHYSIPSEPQEKAAPAAPGTLEYFLVERYLLFSYNRSDQELKCGRVWHKPYQMITPDLINFKSTLFEENGFESPGPSPHHILYSPQVEVDIHPMGPVTG